MKQKIPNHKDVPDFMLKSTLGCALISVFILTPFTVNNFIQGRYYLGAFILIITVLAIIDAFLCYRGRYHKGINLYFIAPAVIIGIVSTIHELGVPASYWAFLGVLSFYFILTKKQALIANLVFIAAVVPVALHSLEQPVAMRFFAVLFGTSVYAYVSMREITNQHYMLKEQAATDSLTGVYNRSLLKSSLNHAIHQSIRTNTKMSLMMLDVDHFKTINDEYGHEAGDSVLERMGEFLKNHFVKATWCFESEVRNFLSSPTTQMKPNVRLSPRSYAVKLKISL